MNKVRAYKQVIKVSFLLFFILLIFLPRMLALSSHWSADETLWMERSRNYFFALESGQFAHTIPAYHPGVTTCWLGSLAIWNKHREGYPIEWFYSNQFLSPEMLSKIRFPITFSTGLLVLLIGVVLYRLFGVQVAGISTLFLAIEPFLLSESRRAHTDVLTTLFLFLSLLLWLCYLEEERKLRRLLVFSGICFGLACLTKSHAGAFLIFLPIVIAWYQHQGGINWKQLLLCILLWITVTLLTVLIVWPYLWTITFRGVWLSPILFFWSFALLLWSLKKLSNTIHSRFSQIEHILLGGALLILGVFSFYAADAVLAKVYDALTIPHDVEALFLGEIRFNPGPLFFPVMWFVWSGLLTFPLIIFAMVRTWQIRDKEKNIFRTVSVLLLFIVFYLIILSCVSKKISRYLVIFLPAVSVLTAIGAVQLAQLWKRKWISYAVFLGFFILQAVPILRLHPNYRAYYHPILSEKWVSENTTSITGAGLDIAAAYLNAKPNARNLRVRLTWHCKDLAHYFVGRTQKYSDSEISPPNFDYDLIYLYDEQVIGDPVDNHPSPAFSFNELYKQRVPCELEHVVTLNGIDYVWIYRVIDPAPVNNSK